MTIDCQTWLVLLRDVMRSNDIGYVLTSRCNERDWSEVLASIVDRKAWELDGVSNTASQRLMVEKLAVSIQKQFGLELFSSERSLDHTLSVDLQTF